MGDEGGLHRMQLVAARHALDGQDIGAVEADRQSEARIDSPAVDQHGAGAALAAVAALLGAGEMHAFAQQVEQGDARVAELDVASLTVDGEADGEVHAMVRSVLWSQWIAAGHTVLTRGGRRGMAGCRASYYTEDASVLQGNARSQKSQMTNRSAATVRRPRADAVRNREIVLE